MGALGLIGVDLPEEHGGLAAPGVMTGLVIEEIACLPTSASATCSCSGSLMGGILARHGDRGRGKALDLEDRQGQVAGGVLG